MGHGNRAHGDVPQVKAMFAANAAILRPWGEVHAAPGAPGGIDGHAGASRQHTDTAGVVAVLMGD